MLVYPNHQGCTLGIQLLSLDFFVVMISHKVVPFLIARYLVQLTYSNNNSLWIFFKLPVNIKQLPICIIDDSILRLHIEKQRTASDKRLIVPVVSVWHPGLKSLKKLAFSSHPFDEWFGLKIHVCIFAVYLISRS